MGKSKDHDYGTVVQSWFRGTVDATPLEMRSAWRSSATRADVRKLLLIRKIRAASGEVIYIAKPQLTAALTPAAALNTTSVLQRSGGTRCFTVKRSGNH